MPQLARSLGQPCGLQAEEAAEREPDLELAADGVTAITSGMRGPWRNRLVHTLPSGRRVISPGNGGRLPPKAATGAKSAAFPYRSPVSRSFSTNLIPQHAGPSVDTARELMRLWGKMVDTAGQQVR